MSRRGVKIKVRNFTMECGLETPLSASPSRPFALQLAVEFALRLPQLARQTFEGFFFVDAGLMLETGHPRG